MTLYSVARDHGLRTNTELALGVCRLGWIPVRRFEGVRCIKAADLDDWRWWLKWWRTRSTMYPRKPRKRWRRKR